MKKLILMTLFVAFACLKLSAQTQYQNSGWLFFANNTKFSEKWGLQFDLQIRSADDWEYVRNTLVRPALQYFINKNHNVAVGYLWQTTQTRLVGSPNHSLNEHRIFEQYIYTHKLSSIYTTHRFRVEQRFIERANEDVFSQRFRYFFRLMQPLQKTEGDFSKGAYVALQDEIFLNLQNKAKINNSVFDQNRLYLAAGYRFSKKLDLEVGYLNQAVKNTSNHTNNSIVQLAVYTRF
ncbi:DUF2490 domain-containing protein [Pedobacter sandarakinus]|uniref:DUF2490 domain-containing protein n=1 Tax=Pedobacter sandarakinus TaxID=353156 RepID=UPI002246B13A|nr:DUF2490 domain-containing protein [Pedobacter sandarakinus]MCX2576002.1 DUF2490 domain-containing protein [Pedobacter sandarakinus]